MPDERLGSRDTDSRVLVLSQRRLQTAKHLAMVYEFEDTIRALDDVHLLAPGPAAHADTGVVSRRLLNGGISRLGGTRRSPPWTHPSMQPTRVVGHHDLFFAVFTDAHQLAHLHRLKGWRERSTRAVCYLTEVWSSGVTDDADYYSLLSQFDAVYLFTPEAGPALTALGAPQPSFLPVGVDAELFAPLPRTPQRVLDVYTYGRTSPVVHRQLLDLVDSVGLTYVYDTTFQAKVPDHVEHRALMANLLQRSDASLAHRINDSAHRLRRTGGEESLSSRYFEISAAGALVLGSRPQTPEFDACFDWPDAVVDLSYECQDLEAALEELSGQRERLERARVHGVRAGLLRHDWVYRWRRVLEDGGMTVPDRVREREARLRALSARLPAPSVVGAAKG